MAELARDIMSISEQEGVALDATGQEVPSATADDPSRHASFDMVIGPAPKGGRLRRSKIPTPKDVAEELADLVSDSALTAEDASSSEKSRSRSRLRLR